MKPSLTGEVLKYFGSEEAYYHTKAQYLKKLHYERQKTITNTFTAHTISNMTYTSVLKTTYCDVLSVSTTIWPSPSGTMKDVRFNLLNKENRRIKPSPSLAVVVVNHNMTTKNIQSRKKEVLSTYKAFADVTKSRQVISKMLKEERNSFMKKIERAKDYRYKLETNAATFIQKYYRRYRVKRHFDEIKTFQTQYKLKRAEYIQFMLLENNIDLRLGTYRREYKWKRNRAATTIQCMFRKYISIQYYYRLLQESQSHKIIESIISIQSVVRRRIAINRYRILKKRKLAIIAVTASIRLQAYIRAFVAKRKVGRHHLRKRAQSILLIQRWVRLCVSRIQLRKRKEKKLLELHQRRIAALQQHTRRFIARRKVIRMKLKNIYNIIFKAVVKIQAWVRKLITNELLRKIEIKNNMATFIQEHSIRSFGLTPPISPTIVSVPVPIDAIRMLNHEDDSSSSSSSSSMGSNLLGSNDTTDNLKNNVFVLSSKGCVEELEKIFQNQSVLLSSNVLTHSTDHNRIDSIINVSDTTTSSLLLSSTNHSQPITTMTHHPYEINDAGDTILTIAAKHGHVEVVRRCLQWGFDPNHRNKANCNALYLSVKYNHIQVMQYLLSLNNITSITPIKQLDNISEEDAADLLIAAVENSPSKGLGALTFLLNHGLKVDSISPRTGLTVYLVAVAVGCIDAVKLILQYEPNADHRDLKRQSLLHKACMSSIELVKVFLGEEEEMDNIYGSISTATGEDIVVHVFPEQALRLKDFEGKDCAAIAALSGQSEILDYVLKTQATVMSSQVSPTHISLQLSFEDNLSIFKLAETNNVKCLTHVIQFLRFDPNTIDPATGMTIMMKAASSGSIDVLEYIMSTMTFRIDLSKTDFEDWNILHHAALCPSFGMMSYLLQHRYASVCNIEDYLLSMPNNTKDTPLHIAIDTAAAYSVYPPGIKPPITTSRSRRPSPKVTAILNKNSSGIINGNVAVKSLIDILSAGYNGAKQAMEMRNDDGLTLLQHACNLGQHDIICKLIELGADVSVMDHKGNTTLWLFLHSEQSPDILRANGGMSMGNGNGNGGNSNQTNNQTGNNNNNNSTTSSSNSISTTRTGIMNTRNRSGSRRTSMSLTKDIEVVISLVKAECPLYKFTKVTSERILSAASGPGRNSLDSGDVIAQENCYELLRRLPPLLPNIDCWRLVLSCIRFSLPSMTTLSMPSSGNILGNGFVGNEDKDITICRTLLTILGSEDAINILWSQNTSLIPSDYIDNNDSNHRYVIKTSHILSMDTIRKLQYATFGGVTLVGWTVKLNNPYALAMLEKEGISLSAPCDVKGNTPLHILVESSESNVVKDIIGVLFQNNRNILEIPNKEGYTASMICAKNGSMKTFKILFEYGCNPYLALKGKYVSWILAYGKKYDDINVDSGIITKEKKKSKYREDLDFIE